MTGEHKPHFQVEAFDSNGFDILPLRTILIIEQEEGLSIDQVAEREVKKLTSLNPGYIVTTELQDVG